MISHKSMNTLFS